MEPSVRLNISMAEQGNRSHKIFRATSVHAVSLASVERSVTDDLKHVRRHRGLMLDIADLRPRFSVHSGDL